MQEDQLLPTRINIWDNGLHNGIFAHDWTSTRNHDGWNDWARSLWTMLYWFNLFVSLKNFSDLID